MHSPSVHTRLAKRCSASSSRTALWTARLGPSNARGFTLIELGVSIVIIAMMATAVVVSVSNIRRADLKKSSGIMAGSMRYLYNLAVINRRPYRLVIDIGDGKFWGEELASNDPCDRYLPATDIDPRSKEEEEERLRAKTSTMGSKKKPRLGREEDEEPPAPAFSKPKDNLLTTRELPRGVKVTGVLTSHHQEVQQEGAVAIHFFPGGYAEKAYIWMGYSEGSDEDEAPEPEITVSLSALMGTVTKHAEVLDERDFFREQDE
jgi:general secretion pathway protein H